MADNEPTALIVEQRERMQTIEDLNERIERMRKIVALLEEELAEKDAYIERLRKLAATRGEWIRRMQTGEL